MLRRTALAAALLAASPAQAQVSPDSGPSGPALPDSDSVGVERRASFDALPLRSVNEVAALAPGVRRDLATGALAVRARPGGPVVVVDGVRQLPGAGAAAVPFDAVGRVRAVTEGVPARYGQAAGGLVLVETGGAAAAFGGRAEAFTSRATDPYDRDLGALTVRGPLGRLGGFSLSAEAGRAGDATPIGGPGALVLRPDRLAELEREPQRVVVLESGTTRTVPVPAALREAAAGGRAVSDAELRAALGVSPAAQLGLVPTLSTFGADDYVRQAADDEPLGDLRLAGTLALEPARGLRVRAGGRAGRQTGDATPAVFQARARSAPGLGYDGERATREAWLQAEGRLTPALGVRLSAAVQTDGQTVHPRGSSATVEDALVYGDVDGPRADVQRRYLSLGSDGLRTLRLRDGDGFGLAGPFGLALLPGTQAGRFTETQRRTDQLAGAFVLRLGRARVEVGADVERQTHRLFALDGLSLAAYARDGDGVRSAPGLPEGGAATYAELPYSVLRPVARAYGYTFNGLTRTDGAAARDLLALGPDGVPVSTDAAPFRPTVAAGYAEAAGRLGALAVRAGLRVERYGRGGETLFDAYANRPVVRAGSLGQRPAGVDEDFAVYYAGGFVGGDVVAFRDRDGRFTGADGRPIGFDDVRALSGSQVVDEGAPLDAAFAPSPAHLSVQPRLALRLAVSPAVSVSTSVDRLSRLPPPELYSTVDDYVRGRGPLVDPGLRPETVDAFRLGVDAQTSPGLAVSVAAFHRRTDGAVVLRQPTGALAAYSLYTNAGETRETGGDVAFVWAPTPSVRASAQYTLAVAEATDADPLTLATLADPVLDGAFAPAPDGARHEVDAALALRTPARLGGLDLGLTLSAQSGLPYTALEPSGDPVAAGGNAFPGPVRGGVNGARLPWTSQLDVRLGKRVGLAGAAVEVFGWVENLLGTDNVLAVYRATGRPDADGFLDSARGAFRLPPGDQAAYRAYAQGPVNVGGNRSTAGPFFYGQPRQIRLGVRATL